MGDERERAAALLLDEIDAITDAVLAIHERLVPHIAERPRAPRVAVVQSLLTGIAHILRGSSPELLAGAVRDAARERARAGYSPGELAILPHGYLPGVRLVFCDKLGAEEGLRVFEVVESSAFLGLRAVGRVFDELAAAQKQAMS